MLKRLARTIPYLRRLDDGIGAMRAHIAALEADRLRQIETEAALRSRVAAAMPYAPASMLDGAHPIAGAHFVDASWCDAAGSFVNGWVHAGPHPVRRVVLLSGLHRAETADFTPRPDVAPHYPGLPPGGAAGFALYLPCDAHVPLVLAAVTDAGIYESPVYTPPSADMLEQAPPGNVDAGGAFVQAMIERQGTVLELGARIVGSMTESWAARFGPGCRYLANDIHAAPGIDVVGDAHTLTAHVAPGSLDGVFSIAVLEHLAAPWRAAAEINRALKPGGETWHVTHQTWPVHETPNDFFRFSDQALRALFGPAAGFEVLDCAMAFPVAIVPPPAMRHSAWLYTPLGRGYGQSYIRARKVAEIDTAAWGAAELEQVSQAYPMPS